MGVRKGGTREQLNKILSFSIQNLNIEYGKVAEQQLTDRSNEMGEKTLQTE